MHRGITRAQIVDLTPSSITFHSHVLPLSSPPKRAVAPIREGQACGRDGEEQDHHQCADIEARPRVGGCQRTPGTTARFTRPLYTSPSQLSVYRSFLSLPLFARELAARQSAARGVSGEEKEAHAKCVAHRAPPARCAAFPASVWSHTSRRRRRRCRRHPAPASH